MEKLIVLFSIMISLLLIFSGQKANAGDLIRYGGQYYPGEFLLDGYDFFKEVNVEVKHYIFSSGTENNEALICGNIDVNVNSDSKSVVLFNAQGDKVLIIGTVQRGNRYSTIVKEDSSYKKWLDLKGEKVGTRLGTGAEAVLRKYFASRNDLDWENFEWVNIKTEDMIAALAHGQIEAFTVWAPTGEIAEAQGVGKLLRNYGDVAQVPVFIHTTKKFAEKNRELLVRFLMAHLKKAELIKNNPGLAAKYAAQAARAKGIDINKDAFEVVFKRIDFQIEFDDTIIDELMNTAKFLQSQKKIDKIPDFYWDTSYLEEAKRRLSAKNR